MIGLCFPADEPVGRGDRFISAEMAELKATVIAVVTKVDMVDSTKLAEQLLAVSKLADFAEIVPVSAVSGHQVDTLVDVMTSYLPPSPQLYPDDMFTDEPEQVLIAELIREAALEGVRDELPHSIAVLVEEMMVEGNIDQDLREPLHRAAQPEVDRHRHSGRPAQGRRHQGARADRGAARHPGLPGPARAGREGVAAGPEAAPQARLLTLRQPGEATRGSACSDHRCGRTDRADAAGPAGSSRPCPAPDRPGRSDANRRTVRRSNCAPETSPTPGPWPRPAPASTRSSTSVRSRRRTPGRT